MTDDFDPRPLIELCPGNDVVYLGLFGSMARGEATASSDIDLLVRFDQPKSLLDAIALERLMSEAIGRPVDLISEAALSPLIEDTVRADLRVLYEAR